jgi:hypothetical protein
MSKLSAIGRYLFNLKVRQRASKRMNPDGSVIVFYNGATMDEKTFNDLFPIGIINHSTKGPRIDSKQRMY